MSTPPLSPSAKSLTHTTPSPNSKRKPLRTEHSKPNESWFLILVNAFKSNFEQTLTYRESELYAWIMQAYPYYRHDMHTMQTSVKTTLSSYECFRQNGRSTWTFIPRRALVHLESLKSEEGRRHNDYSGGEEEGEEEEGDEDENEEVHEQSQGEDNTGTHYNYPSQYRHHDLYEHHQSGSDTRIRYIDKHVDLLDEDSPTLSVEEIQRFKQEHSGAQARKLKRKASGGHASRSRARSPPDGLQDECNMSMEAWCNLLVQMFEASPKQKTIREIFAWVHDNYPIYRNAPGDGWQKDLTAALESNPLFKAMGRGRWQMVTQAPQPVIVVNGATTASGSGSAGDPSVKAEDDATDSPSVTEDEDWKAIGSKRLLNFSFRRYSIATDTVPKNHFKANSTTTSNSIASTSATTAGLTFVQELGLQTAGVMSDETDDDEDPARRYMAPLQSVINSAVLALQSQQSQQQRQPNQDQTSSSPRPASSVHEPPSSNQPLHPQEEQLQKQHQDPNHEGAIPGATTGPVVTQDTSILQTSAENATRPEPKLIIPNGEDLASDQMDAIQALALLCGGGV
ncbi:hypothetical protein BGZ65_005373 [Modicella reniformis]|uniref:Fork-head domain-containing protein n=1 Tax=Modicella reniformis TaxID=1440133 RepID=A0A9P6M8K4_9FUNG|nr:hypothetical protein BGZ65_005373 [Modicella reniformis]